MAGLAKIEEIRFPATLTTTDGVTRTFANATELHESGLDSKTWEEFRGGYREQGSRPYKDGRVSVGAQKAAAAKEKPAAKKPDAEGTKPDDSEDTPTQEKKKPSGRGRRRSSLGD